MKASLLLVEKFLIYLFSIIHYYYYHYYYYIIIIIIIINPKLYLSIRTISNTLQF